MFADISTWKEETARMSRGRPLSNVGGRHPNRLRELRLRFNKSQEEVAAALGVSAVQAGRLERGISRLADEHIDKLLSIIPVEPFEFQIDGPDRRTRAMLAIFRQLAPEEQERLIKLGRALAEPMSPEFSSTRRRA